MENGEWRMENGVLSICAICSLVHLHIWKFAVLPFAICTFAICNWLIR